jgi:hypothetical protein
MADRETAGMGENSMKKHWVTGFLLALAAGIVAVTPAEAVPPFAEQTGLGCPACHVAYPTLNTFGRQFKKNGYQVDPATPPTSNRVALGARVVGRVVDNVNNGDPSKIDPAHEAEVFLTGHPADQISVFTEFEAEDEDGFGATLEHAVLGYHPMPAFNLQLGYGSVFFDDPYDTLADGGRRMTAEHKAIFNLSARGPNGHKLRKPVQQVNANGQVGPVWYMVGVSGGGTSADPDKNGADPGDYQGRLAVDINQDTMIGGYYYGGTDTFAADEDDFAVYGFDLRHDSALTGATVLATVLWMSDDFTTATDEDVTGGYLQVLRPFEVGGHSLVPLVRFEWGDSDTASIENAMRRTILHVAYYLRDNVKVTGEFTNYNEAAIDGDQRAILGVDLAL